MQATRELRREHEGIQHVLHVLEALGVHYGHGKALPPEDVAGVLDFLTTFVDQCHHAKEEEFLFPALEALGVAREAGPIGALLAEHEQGRRLVANLKKGIARYDAEDKTAAVSIQHTIDDYVSLLSDHIHKENSVLFPMADSKLDPAQDNELFEAFARLERERIGRGRHEAFHALLKRLGDAYLVD